MAQYHNELPDLDAPLPNDIAKLVDQGKTKRTVVLHGAELKGQAKPIYAKTYVQINFQDEPNLRRCVSLLKWSDERLQRLPALLALWDWQQTAREGMSLYFGTRWYDQAFFEERKYAFLERNHVGYFAQFGAKPEDLITRHEVVGDAKH